MSRVICLGIGDILLTKLLFETHGITDALDINREIIRIYKNDSNAYWTFLHDLIKKLFPNNQINYINAIRFDYYQYSPTYAFKPGVNLHKYFNLDPVFDFEYGPGLAPLALESGSEPGVPSEPYVVIHTKLRLDTEYLLTGDIKAQFVNALQMIDIGKKIIIMGDKTIPDTAEKAIVNIQSMYPDLLFLKDKFPNLVVDRAVDDLCCSPSIDNFEMDLRILANASMVIGIGGGGYCAMSVLFAKKYTFYVGNFRHAYVDFFKSQNAPNKILHTHLPDFLAELPALLS